MHGAVIKERVTKHCYGAVEEKQFLETYLVMLNYPFDSLPSRTNTKQDHIGDSE